MTSPLNTMICLTGPYRQTHCIGQRYALRLGFGNCLLHVGATSSAVKDLLDLSRFELLFRGNSLIHLGKSTAERIVGELGGEIDAVGYECTALNSPPYAMNNRKLGRTRKAYYLAGIVWVLAFSQPCRAVERPNILFILSDDHATQAISCYGGYLAKYAQTTNIDRLASDGVRLTNCFCSNSICTPSRASILTGQYSHRNGVYLLNQPLPKDAVTFPALMGKAGYKTGVFGKWHLISRPQGFDEYMVLSQQGRYKNPQFVVPGSDELVEKTGWSTDVIADLTMDFIRRRKQDQPFLAMCHFKTTHDPWDSREPHKSLWKDEDLPEPPNLYDQYEQRGESVKRTTLKLERINQGTYPHQRLSDADWKQQRGHIYQQYIKDFLRCGRVLDENIGRLMQFLEDEGLSENTIVVYTSDQGHFLGEHGFFSKRFMYDESIHMPFIVRFPDKSHSGQVVDDMVSNVDFAPTMLDIAGVEIPESMQGRSFLANLQGKTPADWPDAIYYHYWQHLLHRDVTAHYGIRTKDAKLIFYYGLPLGMTEYPAVDADWEYFDLANDSLEMHNRYADVKYQAVVVAMKQKLDEYKNRVGDLDSLYPELQSVREATR